MTSKTAAGWKQAIVSSDDNDRTAKLVSELIRAHGPQLEHLVTQIVRDTEEARQILQDTYLSLYNRLRDAKVGPVINPRAYLFNAASVNALEHIRSEQRLKRAVPGVIVEEDAAVGIQDRGPGPEKEVALQDVMQQLSDLVDALPKKQRQVFVLGKIECLPRRDIAEQMGISESAVDNLMTRALANLRAGLFERGIESAIAMDDSSGR
jgi:RNA polymerase sigma factor (sigma-70 family)